MGERRIDGFFYGLFMDTEVLRSRGVPAVNPRNAHVDDFGLRIGHRATLVPAVGARAYGRLIALTHQELGRLYGEPGLDQYRPEAVLAHCQGGGSAAALCYNLPAPPRADERNPAYALRLQGILRELGFPAGYVDAVTSA